MPVILEHSAQERLSMSNHELGSESERHERTAEALRQSETTIQALLDATMETALLIDTEGHILVLNEIAFERLKRLSPRLIDDRIDDLLGRDVFDLFPEVLAARRKARNDAVIHSGLPARFEDERNGKWMDNTIYPIFDSSGKVTKLAVFSYDITDKKAAEVALQRSLRDEQERAKRDPLTHALNHGAIVEELQKLVERGASATPHAVLMLDVDGLKAVNDTYGHRVGDAMLVAVADVLLRHDATVGRYGSDEFLAVLPGAGHDRGEQFSRDVEAALAATEVMTDVMTGTVITIGVSAGFAIYPDEARAVTKLIDLADSRMRAVKRERTTFRPLRKTA
jgi:diguanylate cyclase (GGDEF)-like protein